MLYGATTAAAIGFATSAAPAASHSPADESQAVPQLAESPFQRITDNLRRLRAQSAALSAAMRPASDLNPNRQ